MVITFTAEIDKIQDAFNTLVIAAVALRCILILTQSRNDSQPIESALQRCKKIILAGIIAVTLKDMISVIQNNFLVEATGSNIEESTIFSGGLKLMKAVISAFMGLDITWTIVDVMKGIMGYIKGGSDEKEMYKKQIRKSLIIGILILCIFGVVQVLFEYFMELSEGVNG